MAAAKTNNQDTYKATAMVLILFGILQLADRILSFSSLGLSWVMNKDNFLLYMAVIFLFFKSDKTVGLLLTGLWVLLNFSTLTALIGSISSYVVPLSLFLLGGFLYWLSTR